MANYYNEIDPFAAEWLKNLIKEGLIPDGEVDTRSIADVSATDLRGFTQCHFFAGIAGWSHALALAGWPDDRPIWTGSCPCQPFSVAGKGKGTADERHLWPVFFNLIRECRPPVVMGEQVSGKAGYGWLDGVRADLEAEDYACRGVDIPACAVDAPHIRQRLYWVALGNADNARLQRHGQPVEQHDAQGWQEPDGRAAAPGVGDMADAARGRDSGQDEPSGVLSVPAERGARHSDMADTVRSQRREVSKGRLHVYDGADAGRQEATSGYSLDSDANGSFWADAVWLTGADGKARRAQPGICLLADGISARASKLRAFGNAIVPPLAAEVIKAFMDVTQINPGR